MEGPLHEDSVPVFQEFDPFKQFAVGRAAALAMEVERLARLAEMEPDWKVAEDALLRPTGGFFQVAPIRVVRAAGREIPRWVQPVISGEGGAVVALVRDASTGNVLVRMKAEPGNAGIEVNGENTRVLVAPTIQFSQGNLGQHRDALAGKKKPNGDPINPIPLANLVLDGRFVTPADSPEVQTPWERAHADGGRFWQKVERHGLVVMPTRDSANVEVQISPEKTDFAWVTPEVLVLARRDGLLNNHLRLMMSQLV